MLTRGEGDGREGRREIFLTLVLSLFSLESLFHM